MQYKDYLKSVYYDVNSPASFTSTEKLYQAVRRLGKYKISRQKIKQWLQEQDVYTLHRGVKRKFSRRKIITSGVNIQWGADLASVVNIAKYNSGVKYLLIVLDVFSKYLFVKPLKSKRAKDVTEAFNRILQEAQGHHSVQILYFDKGGEFNNRLFKSYLQKNNIKYFTTQNENIKVSPVERVIRTFRNKMHKLFQSTRNYRYLEKLHDLAQSYNSTPHRSLPNHMSPSDVNEENEAIVWDHMYNNSKENDRTHATFKFIVGDLVRLAFNKYTFQRDYQQTWTSEIFKISERLVSQGIPVYKVIDFLNEPIT